MSSRQSRSLCKKYKYLKTIYLDLIRAPFSLKFTWAPCTCDTALLGPTILRIIPDSMTLKVGFNKTLNLTIRDPKK